MAELAASKKYFTLENVRLAYRAKDDSFHLTAQDEDFPEGFHMTLSRGSNLELRVRELFEDKAFTAGKRESASAGAALAQFVGPASIGKVLAGLCPGLTFLPAVEDIKAMWEGLQSGAVSQEVKYIFVPDTFFDASASRTNNEFEQFVSAMSPHCFLGILNYKPNAKATMIERIEEQSYIDALLEDGAAKPEARYYFIDTQRPNASLQEAFLQHGKVAEKELPRA